MEERPGRPFLIIFIAVAIVAGLSLVPWSHLTHRVVKDYNLLADIMPADSARLAQEAAEGAGNERVDPRLLAEMKTAQKGEHRQRVNDTASIDTAVVAAINPRKSDGKVAIEDYSAYGDGIDKFKKALAQAKKRPVRIAVIGDSYIEGDIITQDLRSLMQEHYGGGGIGYTPVQNELASGRGTVSHKADGWEMHDVRGATKADYRWLACTYGVAKPGAHTTLRGTTWRPRTDRWSRSSLLVLSPKAGTVTISTDSVTQTFNVPAGEVTELSVDSPTKKMSISTDVAGLVALGAWLGYETGVSVDNMSIRGDSGISHREINSSLAHRMGKYVNYDLVIIEYGINALTAGQKNYDHYADIMVDVINRVRESYPGASILLMGIGDRGQKRGGEVHSMSTAPLMVSAQREAARRAQVLFFDTREAMGGEDAIVDWRQRGMAAPDYIHMNAKGGKEMARLLFNALHAKMAEK